MFVMEKRIVLEEKGLGLEEDALLQTALCRCSKQKTQSLLEKSRCLEDPALSPELLARCLEEGALSLELLAKSLEGDALCFEDDARCGTATVGRLVTLAG